MVTLHVGQKRKKFTAHKKVICTIDYFEKAFNGRFKEAEDGEMYMPEESPEVVGLFIVWLYRGIIPNGNSQKYLDSLYDLYIFGEKIRVIKLMDKIIDKIQDISLAYNKYIDIDFLCKVYQSTRENSEMRRYSAYLFIFKKWKDKQASILNSATALVLEYVPDASEEVIQGISKERIFDQQPFFNPDEIVEFWVKAKDYWIFQETYSTTSRHGAALTCWTLENVMRMTSKLVASFIVTRKRTHAANQTANCFQHGLMMHLLSLETPEVILGVVDMKGGFGRNGRLLNA